MTTDSHPLDQMERNKIFALVSEPPLKIHLFLSFQMPQRKIAPIASKYFLLSLLQQHAYENNSSI
jgi:hypothetical protein